MARNFNEHSAVAVLNVVYYGRYLGKGNSYLNDDQ